MNRQQPSLSGVFPPLPIPFDRSGRVAHEDLAANIARWNAHGLAGYVILGSNGEAAYLVGFHGGPCGSPLQDLNATDRESLRTVLVEGDIIK